MEKLQALEDTVKTDPSETSYRKLLEEFPYLFGYWQKYLLAFHPSDMEAWTEAVQKCPSLVLWTEFLDRFPTVQNFEAAILDVGRFFNSAIIWDKYLEFSDHDLQILTRVTNVPLYDYAKYFSALDALKIDVADKCQKMAEKVGEIWEYEARIKRDYFHVVPVEDQELKAWDDYLDYMEIQKDDEATNSLYKRCLVVTALYPGFWLRYIRWASLAMPDLLPGLFSQAQHYCPNNTTLKELMAAHNELQGNLDRAKDLYDDLGTLTEFLRRSAGDVDIKNASRDSAYDWWKKQLLTDEEYSQFLREHGYIEELFRLDAGRVVGA